MIQVKEVSIEGNVRVLKRRFSTLKKMLGDKQWAEFVQTEYQKAVVSIHHAQRCLVVATQQGFARFIVIN